MKKLLLAMLFAAGTACAGEALLMWDAPTTFEDGSPLDPAKDLTEYTIYWGTAPGNYTNSESVTPDRTNLLLTLPRGKYYFSATATSTDGLQSEYSNEVYKNITSKPVKLNLY